MSEHARAVELAKAMGVSLDSPKKMKSTKGPKVRWSTFALPHKQKAGAVVVAGAGAGAGDVVVDLSLSPAQLLERATQLAATHQWTQVLASPSPLALVRL